MVTFRNSNNNNRRPSFRNNNNRRPSFRNNNEGSKFSNNDSFRRSAPGRNNHNAVKLIEKYNNLASEALANEDKILSENYFQHADHFTRVQNEQESLRMARINSSPSTNIKPLEANDGKEDKILKKIDQESSDIKLYGDIFIICMGNSKLVDLDILEYGEFYTNNNIYDEYDTASSGDEGEDDIYDKYVLNFKKSNKKKILMCRLKVDTTEYI